MADELTAEEIHKRFFENRAPGEWDLPGLVTFIYKRAQGNLLTELEKAFQMAPEWTNLCDEHGCQERLTEWIEEHREKLKQ